MKHNTLTKIITLALAVVLALSLAACGSKTDDNSGDKTDAPVIKIGVPNDTTNEARALLLLQENGIIKLKDGVGITATKNDIVENPHNVEIVEAEAAQLPNLLPDVDYAVINSNYAINAGLNPVNDSLLIEGSASAYANILTVKEGNETSPKALALKAALESKQVADFITEKYAGSVVSVVESTTDGYDASVDYDALKGETITVAASPTPHAEILEVAKEILAAKDITLDIQVFNDYVVPNTVVEDGTVDANYFQHLPYLEDFNAQNGTHIVSIAAIHVEPMGLYGGKQTTLDALSTSGVPRPAEGGEHRGNRTMRNARFLFRSSRQGAGDAERKQRELNRNEERRRDRTETRKQDIRLRCQRRRGRIEGCVPDH